MSHAVPVEVVVPPNPRRWTALVLLCLAQLTLIVDITVVQVALPALVTNSGSVARR